MKTCAARVGDTPKESQCPFGRPQSEMAAEVASWKATEPWSFHPVYARYWRHYHQAMAWMRSHHSAYRKAVESYFSCPWSFPPAALPQSSYTNKAKSPRPSRDHVPASTDSHCGSAHSRRSGQHPPARPRERRAGPAAEEAESESDGGVECDLSNMEITEELRQYFAQTERHREERRKCAPGPARFLCWPCLVHCLLPLSYFITSSHSTSSPTSALAVSRGILIQAFFLALEQSLCQWYLCHLLSIRQQVGGGGSVHRGVPVFPNLHPSPSRAFHPFRK
ncbi:gem-associated protein 8 isoform X1 [Phoca vitulina]|uniref:gem-associated protein 8 isoform X1 n=1 Tax=Phoca vitulina TaxID=9720 RepID=UPI001395FCF9|nr:gem-associated protein 8 isoform X1 [Phoca vitulina]XP_032245532.1 gem-associated protein 8 isoform X1 [Phoca vitulina]